MSVPFPQLSCRYHVQGACLLPEALNPGLDAAHVCVVIARLIRVWDDFVDRAEVFGLSEEQAARIWERLSRKRLDTPEDCPRKGRIPAVPAAAGGGPLLDCPHLLQSVCLLALPPCRGRCGYFALRGFRERKSP